MKILDRYIAKNFLIGYVIAFCVLIGLRIIIDLFINLDEFTEHSDLGTFNVLGNIFVFYALNFTVYFRDFAGMITVIAAAFSFGKMIRSGELVAVMASGVSLKRVIAPIILLSLFLTLFLIIDQEFLIPPLADKLVRSHDDIPGQESYDVQFISDSKGALICARNFDVKTSMLYKLTIIERRQIPNSIIWEVTARIDAQAAKYDYDKARWEFMTYDPNSNNWNSAPGLKTKKDVEDAVELISYYPSDLTPKDIPVRNKTGNKTLLSSMQLAVLAQKAVENKQIKDLAQLYSQKHFRITDPLINLVMLLISLPVLVCRDPKSMKNAIMISFSLTGLCMIVNFMCKLFAAEVVFGFVIPELWAWLPVFIFLPIAFIELDSMKT